MSDYINRGEVRAKLTQYVSTHVYIVLPHIQKIVDDMPSADVRENIHGEWQEDEFGFHHCSKCGWDSIDVDEKEFMPNFCPNCGADMRTYNGYTVSNEYVDYQDRVGADMRGDT